MVNNLSRIGVFVLGALILATLACGPLGQLQGVQSTAEAAATQVSEQLPTLEAQATQLVPTMEAEMTGMATLVAEVTESAPTLDAQATQMVATAQAAAGAGALRQWAVSATASSEYSNPAWSAMQAAGAPDTPECGDINTAWASSSGSGVDWLQLEYATPVIPFEITVVQTYNPGAVVKVEVLDEAGAAHIVYEALPAAIETCPLSLVISITGITFRTKTVIVHLDQTNHSGWNEIDAVELVGQP